MVLTGDLLRRADPERGHFRSLLLKAVKDFLDDARDLARSHRHGGEARFVSWDKWMAEAPSHLMLPVAAEKSWHLDQHACHPERSGRIAAKLPNGVAAGLKAWPRDFVRCVAASTSLGMTALNIGRSALSVRCFASILE